MDIETRTVEFEDVNQIKKKSVTGLLRKRAKQYDSASEDHSSEDETNPHIKKKVQKSSMAAAFTSIMNKKIAADDSDTPNPNKAPEDVTLLKYKKKARDLDEKLAQEDADHKKRILKEQRRLMGRLLPTKSEIEHERSLQIIATRGVVQLFNAVAEYQTSVVKE